MRNFSKENLIADKLSLLFNGDIKQICRRRCETLEISLRFKGDYSGQWLY